MGSKVFPSPKPRSQDSVHNFVGICPTTTVPALGSWFDTRATGTRAPRKEANSFTWTFLLFSTCAAPCVVGSSLRS